MDIKYLLVLVVVMSLVVVHSAIYMIYGINVSEPGMYCFYYDSTYPVDPGIYINISTSFDLVIGDYTLSLETVKYYVDNTTSFHIYVNDQVFYDYADHVYVEMYPSETDLVINVSYVNDNGYYIIYSHRLLGNYSEYYFTLDVYSINESESLYYPIQVYTNDQVDCMVYHFSGYTTEFYLYPTHDNDDTLIFPVVNMTLENYIETINTSILTQSGIVDYDNYTFTTSIPIITGDYYYLISAIRGKGDRYYVSSFYACEVLNHTNCYHNQYPLPWFDKFYIFIVKWKYDPRVGYYSNVYVYTDNDVYHYKYTIPEIFELIINGDYAIVQNFTVVRVSLYYDIYTRDQTCFMVSTNRFLNITKNYVRYNYNYITSDQLNTVSSNITLNPIQSNISINGSWIENNQQIWWNNTILEKKNLTWENVSGELNTYSENVSEQDIKPPDWYNVPAWFQYIFNIFVKTINFVVNFFKMTGGALLNIVVSPTIWRFFGLFVLLVHSGILLYNPAKIYDFYMVLYKYAKEVLITIYNIISKLVQAIASLIEALNPV